MPKDKGEHPLKGFFGGLVGRAEKSMAKRPDKVMEEANRQVSGKSRKVRDTSRDKPPKGFKQVK